MAWQPLSTDEVLDEFTPAEKALLNNIQAEDKLPKVLDRVIDLVRGSVQAGGYDLGLDGTIPGQLRADAINIARWRWLISFPTLKPMQTKDRKDAAEASAKRLDLVANQKLNIESPDGASTAPAASWNSERKIVGRTHPVPKPSSQYQGESGYANPDGPSDS